MIHLGFVDPPELFDGFLQLGKQVLLVKLFLGPSSHCSGASGTPFPQIGITTHFEVQPSVSIELPSSHPSRGDFTPSPQTLLQMFEMSWNPVEHLRQDEPCWKEQ